MVERSRALRSVRRGGVWHQRRVLRRR